MNVPADVTRLPRLPQETETIEVKFKCRLQYKHSALSLNVRPYKVLQAAAWLANIRNLYKDQGIPVDQNWEKKKLCST